jgi:hypothetical protein
MVSSPRTLVISFPRSGLNWLRHCVEYFSGQRTPGHPQIITEGPVLFDRSHDVTRPNRRSDFVSLYRADGSEVYERVALLLRNPYDCFTSHYLGRRGFSFKKALAAFEIFAINIAEFDRLPRAQKTAYYFEDYINQEEETFAFLRFLRIEPTSKPYDFPSLIESSRAWYRNQHGLIRDAVRPQLKKKQRVAIEEMLNRRLGTKFERYLERYHGTAQRSAPI